MSNPRLAFLASHLSTISAKIQRTTGREVRFHRRLLMAAGTLLLLIMATQLVLFAQTDDDPDGSNEPPAYQFYLPLIQGRQVEEMPISTIKWDSRLTERGAFLEPAVVVAGEGYWRLVEARWFDHNESEGRHHILIDSLDANGQRQSGVPIEIRWRDGSATVESEEKVGEPFAANYAMYALAPAYSAQPVDDAPADRVEGMGLGEIKEPHLAFHTSYGLTWRWTIAGEALVPTVTPSVTVTVTPSVTVTPPLTTTEEVTDTPPITVTPTVTATPTLLPTPTVTPTLTFTETATATSQPTPTPPQRPVPSATATAPATATATSTSRPTSTPTSVAAPLRFTATLVNCEPYQNGSRFEGHVTIGEKPANGYNITFSYEPDGPKVPQQPAVSGSDGEPGHYAHILGAGVARMGDWFAWMVDSSGQRISTIATFHTDGAANRCNNATVNFSQP